MLVKRDDKLIYSVQRSALLSGRAGGVQQQQQKGEAKGRRAKECERQRARGVARARAVGGLGAHK